MFSKIILFFINRPIISYILLVILVMGGYYSYQHIPKRQYPLVFMNYATITTTMPHALPEEIEQLITIPLEKILLNIQGIADVTSTSLQDTSIIKLSFDDRVPVDETLNSLEQGVASVPLPAHAQKPIISRASTSSVFMQIGVYGTENLKKLLAAAKIIQKKVEKFPSVSNVYISGIQNERIVIELNPDKLLYYQISVLEIVNILQNNLYQISCGTLDSDKGRIYVKSGKSLDTIKEIENIILRSDSYIKPLILKDIASIYFEFPPSDTAERYNGTPVLRVVVAALPQANTISISDQTKLMLPALEKEFQSEIKTIILGDTTNDIRRRIQIIINNGVYGSIIVLGFILLFMNIRSLILIVFGMFFSFSAMLITLYFLHMTINVASLFGMIIVLGMLVDSSIILSDNINRHLINSETDNLKIPIFNGVSEIASALLLSVLTTVVAFYPLTQLNGMIGKMARDIPVVVICALLFQLFESMCIMPSHIIEILKFKLFFKSKNTPKFIEQEKPWFLRLTTGYLYMLKNSFKYRYFFIVFSAALIWSGYYIYSHKLKFEHFPQDFTSNILVSFKIKENNNINSVVKKIENFIIQNPCHQFIGVSTNINKLDDFYDIYFLIRTKSMEIPLWTKVSQEYIAKIKPLIEEYQFSTNQETDAFSANIITLDIKGENMHSIKEISTIIQDAVKEISDVTKSEDNLSEENRGLSITINENTAHQIGINYENIALSLKYLMGNNEILKLTNAKQDLGITIKLKNSNTLDSFPHYLKQLIKTNKGTLIPLKNIVNYSPGSGIKRILHKDGYRTAKITVFFNSDKVCANDIKNHLNPLIFKLINEYPGYTVDYGDEQKDVSKTLHSLEISFIIACVFIFVLLYLTFNSVLQPLLIMIVIPFGLASSTWALYIHQKPLSIMAIFGMIALVGVIINDSIIFVDFLNTYRIRFNSIQQTIIEGARCRVKQILVTTLTTLGGLLPLAYGIGGKDNILMSLALTFSWGIGLGMIFTLFCVPCLYLIIEDIKNLFLHFKQKSLKSE